MYLLDTDTLSNLIKRGPSPNLISRLAAVPVELQFTSSITLAELIYGAYRLGDHGGQLLRQIEHLLLTNLPILPFDAHAARQSGEVRAALERQGTPIGDADLRIAAIALANSLTVVTGNARHFRKVPGLTVENWLE
jgi:tRNA(fMet)-specific endonuclease VapC